MKRFLWLISVVLLLSIISGGALARSYSLTGAVSGTQRYTLSPGDRLNVWNCTITNGTLVVRGSGMVSLYKLTVNNPGATAVSIYIVGSVTIYKLTVNGPGPGDPTRPSGLTIHGATSGDIQYVTVSDMPGNGVLVESIDHVCSNLVFKYLVVSDCAGGLWLCNAFNCSVNHLTSTNCDFTPPGPKHAAGLVYPCVIDEKVNPADPSGNLIREGTIFSNVECN